MLKSKMTDDGRWNLEQPVAGLIAASYAPSRAIFARRDKEVKGALAFVFTSQPLYRLLELLAFLLLAQAVQRQHHLL